MWFSQPAARKVPEIIFLFWIIKLLTTAMGEAASDFFVIKYNPYLSVFVGAIVLAIALFIQFRLRKYNAWAYWFAVSMVAVFGTMAADALHKQLHVPYTASTIFFAVVLTVVFSVWYWSEKTLSIHSISTRKRELFYWMAVLATFALGTAAGDLVSHTMGLGFFKAGLVFGGFILVPAIVYLATRRNEVLWFWTAYVITRPLGATLADWFGKSRKLTGLNYGDGHVAIILTIAIIILVAYIAITKKDIKSGFRGSRD